MKNIKKFDELNTSINEYESSLNRIMSHLDNHQCAVITAFRNKLINCVNSDDDESEINIYTNKGRNKDIKSCLLYMGYGVTKVKGTYIENYMEENSIEVNEDSFFVVNLENKTNFIENIIKLGVNFCQDSVLILDKGNNYLYGTNNVDFPGIDNKFSVGKFKPGFNGEFMTKVSNRPFILESFKTIQNNTKRIVTEIARPIIDNIKSIKN
jgi:hypothetical protein